MARQDKGRELGQLGLGLGLGLDKTRQDKTIPQGTRQSQRKRRQKTALHTRKPPCIQETAIHTKISRAIGRGKKNVTALQKNHKEKLDVPLVDKSKKKRYGRGGSVVVVV